MQLILPKFLHHMKWLTVHVSRIEFEIAFELQALLHLERNGYSADSGDRDVHSLSSKSTKEVHRSFVLGVTVHPLQKRLC
jgi:hypothetical protein